MKLNKFEVIKGLGKVGVLLPGSLDPQKKWYKSLWTFLSLIGILLTIGNGILAFARIPSVPKNLAANTKLPTMKDSSLESSPSVQSQESNQIQPKPTFCLTTDHPFNETFKKQGVVVDIALSTYKLLGFFTNISIRILVFLGFPQIRSFISNISERSTIQKNKWLKSGLIWSKHEKIFFLIMIASLIERELDPLSWTLHELLFSCSLDWVRILLNFIHRQSQALLSLDNVSEAATFTLLVFIGCFINLFENESGESAKQDAEQIQSKKTASIVKDIFILPQRPSILENESQLVLNLAWEKKIGKIVMYPKEKNVIPRNDSTPSKTQANSNHYQSLNEEINNLIEFYFDTMTLWKSVECFTGLLTLIIFFELTLTFCLITFVGMAAASESGILDLRVACSVFRALIIISKMICVSNVAQILPESTGKIGNKILKLHWKFREIEESQHGGSSFLIQNVRDMNMDPNIPSTGRTGRSLSQVIAYIENNPASLSALGYFDVSKSTLTSITGVILTYLIVLVQFHDQMRQNSSDGTST